MGWCPLVKPKCHFPVTQVQIFAPTLDHISSKIKHAHYCRSVADRLENFGQTDFILWQTSN
jgi:hypothetical protein